MLFIYIHFLFILIESMLIFIVTLQWSLLLRILLVSHHHSGWYFLLILRVIPIVIVEYFIGDVGGPPLIIRLVHWYLTYMWSLNIPTILFLIQFCITGHASRYPVGLGCKSCRWLNNLIDHIDMGRRRESLLRVPSRVRVSAIEVILTRLT